MQSNANAVESGKGCWAVYLKGLLFLAPAALVSIVTAIFIVPKLKQIWANAGGQGNVVFSGMEMSQEFGGWIAIAVAPILLLLEKYSCRWPGYRKAFVSTIVFGLNFAVLLSLTFLLVTAVDLMNANAVGH